MNFTERDLRVYSCRITQWKEGGDVLMRDRVRSGDMVLMRVLMTTLEYRQIT